MRLLTWNILHGGGPSRIPHIALALLRHRPDIVVLTEFRPERGGQLRAVLADHGLSHQLSTADRAGRLPRNHLLLASRHHVLMSGIDAPSPAVAGRWLDASLPDCALSITGVHIPDDSRPTDKAAFWHHLIRVARDRLVASAPDAQRRWIVLGDVNSGRHHADENGATFGCTALLGTFTTLGMTDAWRLLHPAAREPTWNAPNGGGGFRIDAAFLSPDLRPHLRRAEHSHAERNAGVSDHSVLLVDVELPTKPAAVAPERATLFPG